MNEQDLSLGSRLHSEDGENRSFTVQVSSQGKTWLLRRNYDNFRSMDRQLHRCIYDRKFSALPELPPEDNISAPLGDPSVRCTLSAACFRSVRSSFLEHISARLSLHDLPSLSPKLRFLTRSGRPFVIRGMPFNEDAPDYKWRNERKNGVWGRERGDRANSEYSAVESANFSLILT